MSEYEIVKLGDAHWYNPQTDQVEAISPSVSDMARERLREWRKWNDWMRANPDWISRALTNQ